MKVVGIRQRRARLSEYIRLAKTDETALVAERDEVVADWSGAGPATVGERVEEVLEGLVAAGEVTRTARLIGDWRGAAAGSGLRRGRPKR